MQSLTKGEALFPLEDKLKQFILVSPCHSLVSFSRALGRFVDSLLRLEDFQVRGSTLWASWVETRDEEQAVSVLTHGPVRPKV